MILTPGNFEAEGGLKFRAEKDRSYAGPYPAEFRLAAGDLIVVMTDLTQEARILGAAAFVPDTITCLHNQRLGKIANLDAGRLDRRFAYYVFNSRGFREAVKATASGSTVKHTAPGRICAYSFRLPPLPIQRRIASILGAYDDLIEVNRRRIAVLEEMARRLFDEWFVHFRFLGHEGHEMVEAEQQHSPAGWRESALREIGKVITGKTPSKATSAFFAGEIPFVKIPDMHGQAFVLTTFDHLSAEGANSQANKTVPKDAICVSCIGTVGLVSITTEECQTNQQINSIILRSQYLREFVYFSLKSMKKQLINLGSNGATMGNVNKEKFQSMMICVPPAMLLKRYHEMVAPMFNGMLNYSRQTRALTESRDLLLPRLISGDLPLSAAEAELESAA